MCVVYLLLNTVFDDVLAGSFFAVVESEIYLLVGGEGDVCHIVAQGVVETQGNLHGGCIDIEC